MYAVLQGAALFSYPVCVISNKQETMFKVFKSSGIEGNYSVSSYPLFVNNGCWAIYPAKHKTTKKLYSVWQFQKKECESKLITDGIINKNNKAMVMKDIIENIRLFIGNQAKFKHPNFVTVIEPLEDHKNRVLFVTENVINDLNNINKSELDEIMIMKGLLQVCNGIKFLHESVKSVHLNIKPSSVMITENYDWKISGLTFLENITNGVLEKYVDPLSSRMPQFLSIDFRFTCPNLLLNHKVDFIDDLFSICCVIYFLFNDGEHLLNCSASSNTSDYERQVSKLNHVLKNINSGVKHATFQNIPDNFYTTFLDVLRNSQESNTDVIQLKKNYTINDLIESPIFNNELIKTLNVLDDYDSFSTHERINFLKSLKSQIEKFPKPLLLNKFIPILVDSVDVSHYKKSNQPTSEDEELIVEVSENLILLSQSLSQLTFTDKIFPFISTILKKIPFDSFKILLMKSLTIIANGLKSSGDIFQKFSLDLFMKCINENNSMIVQELTLMNVKVILQSQSYSDITTTMLPELCTLYSTTTSLKIKTLAINTFIILVSELETKNIDDFMIVDKVLPLIYKTSSAIFANSKFTTNLITLYNMIFNRLSKSSNKTFNINGNESELYDIVMDLGFNIWKIAKYVSNKQDLNIVYTSWSSIETFLKHDLDSRVTSVTPGGNDDQPTAGVVTLKTINKPVTPIVAQKPIQADYDFDIMEPKQTSSNTFDVLKPKTSSSSSSNLNTNFGVMKPKPIDLLNKPTTTSNLGFGQIQLKQQETHKPAASSTIDWSKANSTIHVMQPTSRKVKAPNFMTSLAPTNSFSKPITKKEDDDDDDDEWGEFGVGTTTTKDWGDSLI